MKSELKIKTAAEYARATVTSLNSIDDQYQETVIAFINGTIMPKIEDMIANPGNYNVTGRASFQAPYPAEKFVAAVAALLTPEPYNFEISQSHDGGGMYATVEVAWIKKEKPVYSKTPRAPRGPSERERIANRGWR